MGIDVHAFGNVRLLPAGKAPSVSETTQIHFGDPAQAEFADGPSAGTYTVGTRYSFYAGSSGSYREWMMELARLVGATLVAGDPAPLALVGHWEPKGGPFGELLSLASGGVIGTTTSGKLLRDFTSFEDHARRIAESDDGSNFHFDHEGGDGNYISYQNFKKAFAVAAADGFVCIC